MFANGGYGDTPAALLWNERAARQGRAGAQFSMARLLDGAEPEFEDLPRRAEYLAMATAQHISHFAAIEELGTMYFDGEIPTPDVETRYKEAARLFTNDKLRIKLPVNIVADRVFTVWWLSHFLT